MKKILTLFAVTSLILLSGCKDNTVVGQTEEPEISTETTLSLPYEGGTFEISYEILNPYEYGRISAGLAGECGWMRGFTVDEENSVVKFTADANETWEERTGTVVLRYYYGDGNSVSAEISVVQAAPVKVTYDYDFDMPMISGSYYGTQYGVNGEHSYYTWVHNEPFESGESVIGGAYYLFDMYAGAPADENAPLPPEGRYTLGTPGSTAEMTFTSEYSRAFETDIEGNTIFDVTFSEGEVNISYQGNDMILDAFLTDMDGKTHHVTYTGPAEYRVSAGGGGGVTVVEEDIDVQATIAAATYIDGDGSTMRVRVNLTDMALDYDGYVVPPGNVLWIESVMPYNEEGNVVLGVYEVSSSAGAEFTLYPGEMYKGMIAAGTYIANYDNMGMEADGLISSGTMTVSETGGGLSITCDFVTAQGYKITGSWSGSMTITGMPGAISTLTGDYEMDLSGAVAEAYNYGDNYATGGNNWMLYIDANGGTDNFQVDFVTEFADMSSGIPSGTYTASSGYYPNPGEFLYGYLGMDGYLYGTMYYGGMASNGYVTDYAPAMSGEVVLVNKGDGTYNITVDVTDDLGNNVTGKWSGPIELIDDSASYMPARRSYRAEGEKSLCFYMKNV